MGVGQAPFKGDHLSGKYIKDPAARGRVNDFEGFAQRYEKPNVIPAVTAYAELAQKHGMTPAQMALAFVYNRWFVASTIIGATTMEQLEENIGAYDLDWSDELAAEIEAIRLVYFNPAP